MFENDLCHLFTKEHQSGYLIYLIAVLNFLYCIMLSLVRILSFDVRLWVFYALMFELLVRYPKLALQGTFISDSSFWNPPSHPVLFRFHEATFIALSLKILRASQVIIVLRRVFFLYFYHSRHKSTFVACALTELVKLFWFTMVRILSVVNLDLTLADKPQ